MKSESTVSLKVASKFRSLMVSFRKQISVVAIEFREFPWTVDNYKES